MSRIARLMLVTLACLSVLIGMRTARAEARIDILSSGARVDFPSGVTFTLDAAGEGGITDVSLLVGPANQRYGAYTRSVRPDFRAGERVTATWTWRRYGSTLPPGADINYRWRLTTTDGTVTETPAATVRVEDTRFQWRELSEGLVTVRWYRGDDATGRMLLAEATRAVRDLGSDRGVDIQRPVTIHIYGRQNDLYSALPGVPSWIGGISIGDYDAVLVPFDPANEGEGRRALAHELAHQLVYQITFNSSVGSKVPTWLNEGLATVAEGETSTQNRRALDQAMLGGGLPTLRVLSGGFSNQPAAQVQLSYAASESVVRYLLNEYGPDAVRSVLARFGEGRAVDDALTLAVGVTQDGVEDGWRRSLGLRPINRGAGDANEQATPVAAGNSNDTRVLVIGGTVLVFLTLLGAVGMTALIIHRRSRTAHM